MSTSADLMHGYSVEDAPDGYTGHDARDVMRIGPDAPPRPERDELAQEIPVALEYNGLSHAALLATPLDLEDLAYGFSLTEGIVRDAGDIRDIEIVEHERGLVVRIAIASACMHELKARRRSLAGRTGCGLCGLESLDEVQRALAPLPARHAGFSAAALSRAAEQLRGRQPLHHLTGATHGAGLADMNGALNAVREDVGRHNALDKLIGHMLRNGLDRERYLAVISSRASFEMVQKTAAAGISALVAVSAPTTYAIALATELNVMLAGFARQYRYTLYAHPEFLAPCRAHDE
ncbi:MAG: formate dehydrogenase accessory sulfurtransferase FdhD [Candidimonas sp.]